MNHNNNSGHFLVQDRLTIDTVTSLYNNGLHANESGQLVIDLSQVKIVDSAAVSLLLSWLREAQQKNIKLCFAHIPENLSSLARLYGVAEMLPLCGDE